MWLLRVLQRRQLVRVSQSLCPRPTGNFLRLGTLSQGRLGCHRMGVKGGFLGMLNMTSPDQLQFCLNLQPEGLQVPKNHQGLTRECSGAWVEGVLDTKARCYAIGVISLIPECFYFCKEAKWLWSVPLWSLHTCPLPRTPRFQRHRPRVGLGGQALILSLHAVKALLLPSTLGLTWS